MWAAATAWGAVGRVAGWMMDSSGAAALLGDKEQLSLWISFSHPRMQHIKAIKKSSAQHKDFKGKYECTDTAFLDQRGEIAEGKLSTAGMSIRNRLIPREFFFLSVL